MSGRGFAASLLAGCLTMSGIGPGWAYDCPPFEPPEAWSQWEKRSETSFLGVNPRSQPTLIDDFETKGLNEAVWTQFNLRRFELETDVVRDGSGAMRLFVDEDDIVLCGVEEPCQRNELREANQHRLEFGADAWYAFSFRVTGDIPRLATPGQSARLVLGQWKQTNGESPFLAQRYDNGVFHITVQDGTCRKVIAQAPGDAGEFHEALGTSCMTDIELEPPLGTNLLPDPYDQWVDMVYRVRGDLNGKGIVEVWANGQFIVRATGSIGHVEGDQQYFKYGIYRRCTPGEVTAYIDNFRRGPTRDSIEQP